MVHYYGMVEEIGPTTNCPVHKKPLTMKKRIFNIMGTKVSKNFPYCPDCELIPKHNREEIEWFGVGVIDQYGGKMKMKWEINPPEIAMGSFSKIRIIFDGSISYTIEIPSNIEDGEFIIDLDDPIKQRYKK